MKHINLIAYLLLTLIINMPVSAQLSKAQRNYIDIIVTPDHADWLYRTGDKPVVRVMAFKSGIAQDGAAVTWKAGPEMMKPEHEGRSVIKNGKAEFKLPTMKTPGFLQCQIEVEVDGTTYKEQIKTGFSVGKIKPTVPFPADFDAYWANQLKLVSTIPLEMTREFSETYSTGRVAVYKVSYRINKEGHRMNGWLMIPRREGTFPAVLMPPGAGIKPQTPSLQLAENGIITLQTEIHGLPVDMPADAFDGARRAFGDYMFMNLDNRDKYYYNRVYLGCKRGIDLLASLPEANGKFATSGGSQGGALAIVTAALDKRVNAVVAFYPALCDVTGYLQQRAGGWPHLFNEKNAPFMHTPEKVKNVAYYDVVNFARTLRAPGFFSFGYNDNVCPPTSVYAAVNSVKSPLTIVVEPVSGHWRFPETNQKSINWLLTNLQ